jgi:hypothetical protein
VAWPTAVPGGAGHLVRPMLSCMRYCRVRTRSSSRLAAGRMPRAGVGVPAASGSRSWCHRRGGTARRWRPARGRWLGRRRAVPRIAPAAAPEPPNREKRQSSLSFSLLSSRLGLLEDGWAAPGARGLDGFRDATLEERRFWAPPGEVVPIELPAHGGGGQVQRLSPAPARFWAVPRTQARASGPVLEPGSDDRAEAGYQRSHDDAQRAGLKTGALVA